MTPFKYRPDIDGLRAIAVAAVVAFHAFPYTVPGGFVGVDVFFVISGFLISGIILADLQNGAFSFADFYARRVKRILPALVLVLAASCAVGAHVLLSGDFEALGKHIIAAGTFVTNFVLWSESGYFDTEAQAKPLLHLWSLGIEEQFYIVWPALLFVFFRRKLNIGYLLASIIALSFAANVILIERSLAAAFYSPASRFWELMCGAVLAYWAAIGRSLPSTGRLTTETKALFGLACILGASLFFTSELRFPGWWALIPVLGTCCIIDAGPDTLLNKAVLSSRPLVWLGLISYALYLWHWPLLSFAYIEAGGTPSRGMRVLLVLAAVVLAAGTYLLVERPIRFWQGYNRAKVTALCSATCVLIGLGAYVFVAEGRMTEYQRAFNIRYVEMKDDWRGGQCLIGPDNGWPISEAAGVRNFDPCVEAGDRPLLILWGDSFAAHLYPGIREEEAAQNYRIGQFTFNACPPLIDFDVPGRPYCEAYQSEMLDRIIALKPAYLVMASAWGIVQPMPVFLKQLRSTIDRIRSRLPTVRITLVGNPPIWKERLPALLQKLSVVDNGQMVSSPDIRLAGQIDEAYNHDNELSSLAETAGVGYLSLMKVLCDEVGCLSREGRDFQNLFSMDTGHLTPIASKLVARQLAPYAVFTGGDKPHSSASSAH